MAAGCTEAQLAFVVLAGRKVSYMLLLERQIGWVEVAQQEREVTPR